MGWTTTAQAIIELRDILKDNATDKLCVQKEVIGPVDGVNTLFSTFEYRRVTNFTQASGSTFPVGLWKNGTLLNATGCTLDDPQSGAFQLVAAPSNTSRDKMRATYYYQWFVDSELDAFLQHASSWLGFSTTYTNIDNGLNPACLRYAAQEAYEACAMKYSQRAAEKFQLEDTATDVILKSVDAFREMADNFLSKAETFRDDFYKRQGQSNAPLYNLAVGAVRDPVPRR